MNDLADLDAATAAFVAAIRARQLEAKDAAAGWLPANGNGTASPLQTAVGALESPAGPPVTPGSLTAAMPAPDARGAR